MADETRTLVGTWIEYLKKNRGEPAPTDKEFSSEFDREMRALTEIVITEANHLHEKPDKFVELRRRQPGMSQRLDRLRGHYVTRYRMWKVLADERRQHSRAITIDHLKLFASRLVYAIMIACVVLATGYVAKIFDIPLPLFRGIVP